MTSHKGRSAGNEGGTGWLNQRRSPRASAWHSRSVLSIAASFSLAGIAVAFGVARSQRPEQDQYWRLSAPHSASSEGTAHSLEPAATLAAQASSEPAKAQAQAASPSSAASSAWPARQAPKREPGRTAAGASTQPFPNLSFSAFTLPNDFTHETSGPASDSLSSPSLPAHDSAPSLNPGLPNNGTTSGSSPNPALTNNGSP
jgi:hypothetical protein